MKKLAILAVAVLGTFAMANAQTTPAPAKTKEVKTEKHDKKANKKAKAVMENFLLSAGRFKKVSVHLR